MDGDRTRECDETDSYRWQSNSSSFMLTSRVAFSECQVVVSFPHTPSQHPLMRSGSSELCAVQKGLETEEWIFPLTLFSQMSVFFKKL